MKKTRRSRPARVGAVLALALGVVLATATSASASVTWEGNQGCRSWYTDSLGNSLGPCAFDSDSGATTYGAAYFDGYADHVYLELDSITGGGGLAPTGYSWDFGPCHGSCTFNSPNLSAYDVPYDTQLTYVESYESGGVHRDQVESPKIWVVYPV